VGLHSSCLEHAHTCIQTISSLMRTYFLLWILHYCLPLKMDFPILTATVYKELHSSNPCSVFYPHSSTISIWPLQYYTYSKEPGNEASIRIYFYWNWGWGYSTSTTTYAPIGRSVWVHIIYAMKLLYNIPSLIFTHT